MWFCPEAAQSHVRFSVVFVPNLVLGCGVCGSVLGARALWLQELKWLCYCLGPGLPLWQASPRTCEPQIWLQAEVWGGQSWSALNHCVLLPKVAPPGVCSDKVRCGLTRLHCVHASKVCPEDLPCRACADSGL